MVDRLETSCSNKDLHFNKTKIDIDCTEENVHPSWSSSIEFCAANNVRLGNNYFCYISDHISKKYIYFI